MRARAGIFGNSGRENTYSHGHFLRRKWGLQEPAVELKRDDRCEPFARH